MTSPFRLHSRLAWPLLDRARAAAHLAPEEAWHRLGGGGHASPPNLAWRIFPYPALYVLVGAGWADEKRRQL